MMTTSSLTCLILAAGLGTRMRTALPKPLHPVAGRPMILHALEAVSPLNPARCVVVIGPGMESLAQTVAPCPVAIQSAPKGTGDAVRAGYGTGDTSADVLVLYGDTPLVSTATLQALLARRRAPDNPAVVVSGMTPPNPTGYGRLVVNGEVLQAIVEEKDATPDQKKLTLCNGGIMVFDGALLPDLLASLTTANAKGEYYLTDTVAAARARGRMCAYVEIPHTDVLGVNTRAELATVEALMQQRLRAQALANGATLQDPATTYLSWDTVLGQDVTVEPSVFFGPGVRVENHVTIRAFSHLEGVTLGEGAVVGPFARLRPGTQVGEGAHVGNFVELKNTTLEPGAKANHLTYLGDAHVGAGANIGAGTITCNYDGFTKSRTTIGAGAFIGSNAALVAPVTIGPDALVAAGSVITADVSPDTLAITRAPPAHTPACGMATRRKERS